MPKITIKEIARLAGVSTATVSYVMNNRDSKVSEATRLRVLSIMEELNYKPSATARGLNSGKSRMVGLIVPDISKAHFSVLVSGIETVLHKANYGILICNAYNDLQKEREYYHMLADRKVDGMIVAAGAAHDPYENSSFSDRDIPIVMIDRYNQGFEQQYGVYSDNYKGTYWGTRYLIEEGHTRIGCITGPLSSVNTTERIKGYREALRESGIAAQPHWLHSGNHALETGIAGLEQIMSKEPVTAVIAGGDLLAYGVYQAANQLQISIPNELSVIGVDDNVFSELITPTLTALRPPLYEIGDKAAVMLQLLIDGQKPPQRKLICEPELVVRESTRKIIPFS